MSDVSDQRRYYERMMDEIAAERQEQFDLLKAENAKLRELVRDYYMFEHGDCRSCRYHDECRKDESCRCIAPMRLADRMRELGVEVDDGY